MTFEFAIRKALIRNEIDLTRRVLELCDKLDVTSVRPNFVSAMKSWLFTLEVQLIDAEEADWKEQHK